MRCMELNKQSFYYSLYEGKEEIEDEWGNKTGEYKLRYSNPVEFKANISAARGETQSSQFGESVSYDKTIISDKERLPLDEYSVLWVDVVPELNEDGSLATDEEDNVITPHDYVVKKVGKSLHTVLVAISKVTVSEQDSY